MLPRLVPCIEPRQQYPMIRPARVQRLDQLRRPIERGRRLLQIVQQAAQFLVRVLQRLTVIARPLRHQMPAGRCLRRQIDRDGRL